MPTDDEPCSWTCHLPVIEDDVFEKLLQLVVMPAVAPIAMRLPESLEKQPRAQTTQTKKRRPKF